MNKKEIANYIEIYIKSDIQKIIKFNKKKIYHIKNKKNVWGFDLKPEFPKKPDITIINNFNKKPRTLNLELKRKISKLIK